MTVRAKQLTPEVMLSAPRRSAGIPNGDCTLILYTVSTYDFSSHKETSEVRVYDAQTNESTPLTDDGEASSPIWIDDETVAMFRSTENGTTELLVGQVMDFKGSCYVVETIDAAASELKVAKLGHEHYGLAFTAPAAPDGSLYNSKKQAEVRSSGKLYRSLYVRHWDHWVRPYRNAVWYASLSKDSKTNNEELQKSKDKYQLSPLYNALKDTGLECPIDQPGREGDFDIGKHGLVFIAKDPVLNPATNTKCNIYLALLPTFRESSPPIITANLDWYGMKGAMESPTFSADGNAVAFLVMKENGYEADQNHMFIMPHILNPAWLVHLTNPSDPQETWDLSPQVVRWSDDRRNIYFLAEEHGRTCLWSRSIDTFDYFPPRKMYAECSVKDIKTLANGKLFASASSMTDSSVFIIFDAHNSHGKLLSSNSHQGSSFGLSSSQLDEIWFPGASNNAARKEHLVHAWVLKPSTFKKEKSYPLAFLVHGGPQAAWLDSWGTRWNPAVWAEQGYVVVLPNPTGSTGYGQAFCDSMKENWGGLPYQDLVKCFDYIERNLAYVDTARAVALGASYGGYMMNWIQGHALANKFKALVCHDGIFSTISSLATEELYFPNRDLGGPWSQNKDKWLKWDPAQHTHNWKTPMLVIHSDLDYRLTIGEGLAAFNILQSNGVHSEFLTFPDENHFVTKPENALKWYIAILNFINPYVGLPAYQLDALDEIIQDPQAPKSSRIVEVTRDE